MPKNGETRRWTPQGVGDFEPYELRDEDRDHLIAELKDHGIELDDPGALFDALARAISMYRSDQRLAESCTPAQVRENLGAALGAADELYRRLEALDGNSFVLLTEAITVSAYAEREMPALIDHADRIREMLRRGLDFAKECPERGRLPDIARYWLACDVARIVSQQLRQTPTTTKNGLYVSLLELTLEIATGREAKAVHELARQVVAFRQWQIDNGDNPN